MTALVRSNLSKATREVSGEVEQHLHALQRELQSWAYANPNIKPYCHGHIGWLLRKEARDIELVRSASAPEPHRPSDSPSSSPSSPSSSSLPPPLSKKAGHPRQRRELDLSGMFEELFDALPPPDGGRLFTEDDLARVPLPDGMRWHDLSFLLVPGLLTKWYPMYMKALRSDMKRLGLHAAFSRVDTDQPVRINAARLRHEVLEMAQAGRKIVLLGHSKGAVDAAAALSLFPELCDFVAGLVSLQGPHGGSAIAHDLSNTHVQKTVVLGALEKLLRGCKHAVLDLSFESRQEFVKRHAYPLERVPTLCVATAERRQSSLLTPLIEYVAVRYGAVCDGLVCQADAVLPHCVRVVIDDMDHFGPAWGSFPATDRYDPTRLWLSCISLALRFGGGGGRPSAALAGGSLRGGSSMRTSPDTAAAREEVA